MVVLETSCTFSSVMVNFENPLSIVVDVFDQDPRFESTKTNNMLHLKIISEEGCSEPFVCN